MNYLAIDTSGKNLTIAINFNGKEYLFHDDNCGVNHSVAVMEQTEKLLEEAKATAKDMDFFAVVVGAGSFTGIRIGVATVKAFCFAFNKPCLEITSFDTIAYNNRKGKVLAVIDARHNGYYVCGYEDGGVCLQPSFVNGERVIELVQEGYELLSFEKLANFDSRIVSVADGLVLAIKDKLGEVTDDINSVKPLYIRKSQAEEGR